MALLGHQRIGGIALQAADFDRFAFGGFAHAGLFAQILGRADAGAHAAEDVLIKDCFRRSIWCAGADLADEQRDVDAGRAGRHAGRVIAEIAAVRRDAGFVPVKGGVQVGKVLGKCFSGQAGRCNSGSHRVGHGWILSGVLPSACHSFIFYQTVNFWQFVNNDFFAEGAPHEDIFTLKKQGFGQKSKASTTCLLPRVSASATWIIGVISTSDAAVLTSSAIRS